MSFPSLLLVSLLWVVPLAATDAAQPASPSTQQPTAELLAAAPAYWTQPPLAQLASQMPSDLARQSDGICYKIRAYIFKRDDDHAPELAGTTTCGPSQPRAKEVVWPKARLIPAN